jgi:uncharacterized membrane protein YfcA
MQPVASIELIVIVLVVIVLHYPVYRAYRKNKENNKPSKIWAAVLLSFVPTPICGILYVVGIIPALILFIILIALIIAAYMTNFMDPNRLRIYFSLIMAVTSGYLASRSKKKIS